jgi:GNAT superfamily N-acetyltransferase
MSSQEVEILELSAATPAARVEAARELLLEYGEFVLAQPSVSGFCYGSLREEADGLPSSYIRQGGGSLLALVRGEAAGFVAWRALTTPPAEPHCWELKRLWVRSAARGIALGQLLTQAVIDRARAVGQKCGVPGDRSSSLGCKAIYLDTVPQAMAAAHRLYLEMGFVPCAAYNDSRLEGLIWMVKFL